MRENAREILFTVYEKRQRIKVRRKPRQIRGRHAVLRVEHGLNRGEESGDFG